MTDIDQSRRSVQLRRLPRLPSNTLLRPRVTAFFALHSDAPVRALVAPSGFGKTTLVCHYLNDLPLPHSYVAFDPNDDTATILARLGKGLGFKHPDSDLDGFMDALDTIDGRLIVLDDADIKDGPAAETLRLIIDHVPDHLRLIVCARSREVFYGARTMLTGKTAYLGAEDLAFTTGEIAQLCDLHGLQYTPRDVERLFNQTEGWPIVVSSAIRTAAIRQQTGEALYATWRDAHAESFRAFILEEATRSAHGDLLRRMLLSSDIACCSPANWETIEHNGLFARKHNGRIDFYRTLLDVFPNAASAVIDATRTDLAPLVATFLGEFSVTIGGRPLRWVRRKDARIYKYLLLKPRGIATRQELLDVFWPDQERQTAAAALRTTCSNIRHALREAVGLMRAQSYLLTDLDIRVPIELVISDLQQLRAQAAAATFAEENGDSKRARVHWGAVRALDTAPFVADVPCVLYGEIDAEIAAAFHDAGAVLNQRAQAG